MEVLKLYSGFRNREIIVVDDCGCKGGISEIETTEHGFNGASWVVGYAIKCNDCNKTLTELPEIAVKEVAK